MTHDPQPNVGDLDPDQAITEAEFSDPTPDPVEDPGHPDYVEPGHEYTEDQ